MSYLADLCCISFDSYIKPQQFLCEERAEVGCISFDSYIKPQPWIYAYNSPNVVYLLIPTSNHNPMGQGSKSAPVVYLLIPTSNHNSSPRWATIFYVVYLLIPTSNHNPPTAELTQLMLYIFWFLHQTTTIVRWHLTPLRCISFDSYIKPQHHRYNSCCAWVVYLLIPTSNHNHAYVDSWYGALYIFWFLHQTTTEPRNIVPNRRCISFDSYIKPQLACALVFEYAVVYLLIPTSNHNYFYIVAVVAVVVYLLIPTSNHNSLLRWQRKRKLYIFWFLHQTTTW